jgi:hypothetical protein
VLAMGRQSKAKTAGNVKAKAAGDSLKSIYKVFFNESLTRV